MLNFKYMPKV